MASEVDPSFLASSSTHESIETKSKLTRNGELLKHGFSCGDFSTLKLFLLLHLSVVSTISASFIIIISTVIYVSV